MSDVPSPPPPPPPPRPLPSSGTTNPPVPVPPAQRPLPSSGTTTPPMPLPGPVAAGKGAPTAQSGAPVTPAGTTTPPRPPIDYAMRAPKTYLPSPALVKNLGCIFKMLFGFAILILMGYFALIALNPKARQWATSKKGPTPFKTVNQILAIPAQAIGKTNDVVAANNANVHVLDKVIAEEEGKARKSAKSGASVSDPFANVSAQAAALAGAATAGQPGAPGAAAGKPDDPAAVSRESLLAMQEKLAQLPDNPNAAPMAEAPKVVNDPTKPYSFTKPTTPDAALAKDAAAPAPVKLPGGIVISSASPLGAPAASPSFLYWVVNQNISAVFQNSPHRILLDKRLVYEGQEVSAVLGVTFDHLEPEKKLIVFRDKSGAFVTRSY